MSWTSSELMRGGSERTVANLISNNFAKKEVVSDIAH